MRKSTVPGLEELAGVETAREYLRLITDGHMPQDWRLCPVDVAENLIAYVRTGVPLGSFLEAIVANDLLDAFGRADNTVMIAMAAITGFVYNRMPGGCHARTGSGSREPYQQWIDHHAQLRKDAAGPTS